MDENVIDVSGFVKRARNTLKLTQPQLAELLGCTKGNVSAWENNLHQPSYSQLCWLSRKSGLPLPHDKAGEVLEMLEIDPNNIDVEQITLVKDVMKVKEENRPQVKKIIETFVDESGSTGEKGK